MFGFFRLLLAFLVFMSHSLTPNYHGLNPGVIGVVGFYLLSGHLMSSQWDRVFVNLLNPGFKFYRDRSIRIFPTYLFALIISVISLVTLTPNSNKLTLESLVFNFSLVLLNLFPLMANHQLLGEINQPQSVAEPILPPAWSLSSELQFYLLLPLLKTRHQLKYGIHLLSLLIFLFGAWIFKSEIYTYRLIIGTAFIFISGMMLNLKSNAHHASIIILITYLIMLANLIGFKYFGLANRGFVKEISLGYVFLLPVIFLLSKLKSNRLDNLAGQVAYPIFLFHSIVIFWATQNQLPLNLINFLPIFIATLILSFLMAVFVENPITRWRKKSRY